MKILLGLLLLLFSSNASAECVTLDIDGWTQREKNMVKAAAYDIIYKSGIDVVPTRIYTRNSDGVQVSVEICVDPDQPVPNFSRLITATAVKNRGTLLRQISDQGAVENEDVRMARTAIVKAKLMDGETLTEEEATDLMEGRLRE